MLAASIALASMTAVACSSSGHGAPAATPTASRSLTFAQQQRNWRKGPGGKDYVHFAAAVADVFKALKQNSAGALYTACLSVNDDAADLEFDPPPPMVVRRMFKAAMSQFETGAGLCMVAGSKYEFEQALKHFKLGANELGKMGDAVTGTGPAKA